MRHGIAITFIMTYQMYRDCASCNVNPVERIQCVRANHAGGGNARIHKVNSKNAFINWTNQREMNRFYERFHETERIDSTYGLYA